MNNYMMIDGKKIPISEQTANSIRELQANPKRREPEYGERYFYLSGTNNVMSEIWHCYISDKKRYKVRNCFKTREEAEFESEKREVLAEIQNFADDNNDKINWEAYKPSKWYFYYDARVPYVAIGQTDFIQRDTTYFTSEEIAEQARDKFGDRYIKYALEIK